jgi:hypothetical protein
LEMFFGLDFQFLQDLRRDLFWVMEFGLMSQLYFDSGSSILLYDIIG